MVFTWVKYAIFICLIIFFKATTIYAAKGNNSALPSRKIVLNWKAEPEFGGMYAADQRGFFKKHNLNVQILEGGSGTPTVQMVAAGQADYGVVSGDELVLSRDRGTDLIAIFAVYQKNPMAFLLHAEHPAKSIQELYASEGTILALIAGQPFNLFFTKAYPKSKAKIVPYPGGISTFLQNKNYAQQCFYTAEPLQAEKAGAKVKTFLFADAGYNPYNAVVVTKASFFKKNKTEVQRFVQALKEGWLSYNSDPSDINISMNKLNPSMDLDIMHKSAQIQLPFIVTPETKKQGLGVMVEDRWKTLIHQLRDVGLIKGNIQASEIFINP